jgi:hypothetical protein
MAPPNTRYGSKRARHRPRRPTRREHPDGSQRPRVAHPARTRRSTTPQLPASRPSTAHDARSEAAASAVSTALATAMTAQLDCPRLSACGPWRGRRPRAPSASRKRAPPRSAREASSPSRLTHGSSRSALLQLRHVRPTRPVADVLRSQPHAAGLWGDPGGQWKLQVDGSDGRPSCLVSGPATASTCERSRGRVGP